MHEQFLDELCRDIDDHFAAGRRSNLIDIALKCVVVVASLAAASLAAADLGSSWRWLTTATAALPAALTSIQSHIRVAELSTWYFRYSAALRSLKREFQAETDPDIKALTKRRSAIEDEFEQLWHDLKVRPTSKKDVP
jgi:hypothetical protein